MATLATAATYTLQGDMLELRSADGALVVHFMTTASLTSPTAITSAVEELSGLLTGTVTYRQRIALPADSVIEVQLQDVSKADAAAAVLATQTLTTTGENVPLGFTLAYDPAQIDPRFTYALQVRITSNGELRWINTEQYAVLTRGAPTSDITVVVQPAR